MMKWLGGSVVLVIVAAAAFVLWGPMQPRRGDVLPWQITVQDGVSHVFGLTLERDTLADAARRFGTGMEELAIIAAPREPGSLEAYYSDVVIGPLTGKLIVVGAMDEATLMRLRRNAVKTENMYSATRRFTLAPTDRAVAERARISSITFIPSVRFDAATAVARFGRPAERVRTDKHTEHLLYPDKGIDVILSDNGKNVLQYVAPRNFARLRAPLETIKGPAQGRADRG